MNFSELNLHPTVAGALAKRGYETATPVQAAVLHPDAAGRDLLVSSQTGSGKTIAFGAALAENLLAADAARTGNQRTNPLALVIVPTRELAVQVRDELSWLLRDTKLRLASFTGGTPVTGDLRTLQKGLDVAIGTPGRLVDLLKRQRLELSELRVVVLDEADEMLDLGFREDLQTILQAAPATRRTLLLSATLPAEIQALARRFQKDALRIDPRKDGDPAARGAHVDITYVAHLIVAADRLAVVVNILRAAGEGRAIVFCTTREGVSRLHAALLTRGFAATAISGDRAQAERDRALEQVRRGDARILVATNVAARGLHLPDVDLIIHADLPLNAESLTHRSGRTGRAGRKGTAVVLASLTERRKAERLLMSANVPVVWTAPPSADTITAAARERLAEELLGDASADELPAQDPAAEEMVRRLETVLPAREVARRLLLRELKRLPVGERVHHVPVPGNEPRNRFAPAGAPSDADRGGRRPGRQDFAREGVAFRVNIGTKDNADPRWLLPLICRRGGVTSRDVGAIRIGPQETMFEISGDVVRDFELSAAERDPRAPHVMISRLTDSTAGPHHARSNGPQGGRSQARPERPFAPAAQGRSSDGAATRPNRAPVGTSRSPDVQAEAPRSEAAASAAAVPSEKATKKKDSKRATAASDTMAPGASADISGGAARPAVAATAPAGAARTSRVPEAMSQPASIFQTRTPVVGPAAIPVRQVPAVSPPHVRAATPHHPEPVVEMKRAARIVPNGHRPEAKSPLPAPGSAAAPPHHAPRADSPRRTDGNNPPKRSFGSPTTGPAASPAPRRSNGFERPARPDGGRHDARAGGSRGGTTFPPRSSTGSTRVSAGPPRPAQSG
ncbi:MAG: DEAD/DEAH box helicase, partial [Polyangia bacterium]